MHEEGQLFGNIGWERHIFWLYNRQELAESTYFSASGKNPQIHRSDKFARSKLVWDIPKGHLKGAPVLPHIYSVVRLSLTLGWEIMGSTFN